MSLSRSGESASSSRSRASNPTVSIRLVIAAEIVFRHLMFLNWKSPGRTIYLANGALSEKGVSRFAKYRALASLKKLGLIRLKGRAPANRRELSFGEFILLRWAHIPMCAGRNRNLATVALGAHTVPPLSSICLSLSIILKV